MAAKIFRINYKSDFILTLESDAGWMTPFCIKFWTGAPSQAFFAGWDGTTYTHCSYDPSEPTKLVVQFDDHHLPIGDLKLQIAYHFTVADFPNDTEDEVINPADITTLIDGQEYQVMLDFTGETAPEIQFSLPAYANEAQRIENEQQRIENEQQRIANEQERIDNEQTRQRNEGTRIENEQQRVQEFGQMKGELEQATRDAAAAAENANEKGVYAKNQGDYAKQQGDYAKQQGDIAQADHERAEEDHRIAGEDHTQAGSDHTRAGEDHTQAGSDHTRANEDHTRAGDDHTRADQDHTRAESDHAAVEVYVDSLGAFDISAYHATGGVLATYANLQAALGTNGANIPDALRKGGMSVKFVQGTVQSSDNKYIQYRLTADEWSTTIGDWVEIKDTRLLDKKPYKTTINSDGSLLSTNSDYWTVSDYYQAEVGLRVINGAINHNTGHILGAFYDENFEFVSLITKESGNVVDYSLTIIPEGAKYVRFNLVAESGYVIGNSATTVFDNMWDIDNFVFDINISSLSNISLRKIDTPETVDGVTYESGSLEVTFISNTFVFLSNPNYKELRPVRALANTKFYLHYKEVLYLHIDQTLTSEQYNEFVVGDYSLLRNKNHYIAFVENYYGELMDCVLSRALPKHIDDKVNVLNGKFVSLVLSKHGVIKTGKSAIDANGNLIRSGVDRLSDYFYAYAGSIISKPFYSGSAPGNVVFYDFYLNPVGIITGQSENVIVLDDNNIPSGAVYFKAALKQNDPQNSFVRGIVAEGVEDRAFTKKRIYLCHEYGNIPKIVLGANESVKLIYPAVRVYIKDSNNEWYLTTSAQLTLTVSAGEITIPRYGAMYIDTVNMRYAVSSTNYTVIDTETGYDIVNGVAYYDKNNLPGGQFLQVLRVAANCAMSGILLDSITDARIRNIEDDVEELKDGNVSGIINYNPSSEYDALMQSAKCPSFNFSTKQSVTPYPTSLLWLSDIHGGSEALKNIMLWKSKYSSLIDDVIATGDQVELFYTDNFDWWNNNGGSGVLQAIGNHDAWISKEMYQTGDYDDIVDYGYGHYDSETGLYNFYIIKQKQIYDKFFKDRISSWNVTQPSDAAIEGKCYYYKDYAAVRLIVLDSKHYGRGADLVGGVSTQDTWLKAVLADAKTNSKPVVIADHYYPGLITSSECNYSEMFQGNGDDKLSNLAYNSVKDFIDAGGEFVCWIVGHTHEDNIGLLDADNRQLVVNVTTANVARASYTPRIRFANTKTADAFNFICFDTVRKLVKIVRVGADTTDLMNRYRKTIYRYADTTAGNKGIVICE